MDDAVWFVACVRKFRAARDGRQLSAESDMYTVHRVARMWSVDDEASDRIGSVHVRHCRRGLVPAVDL